MAEGGNTTGCSDENCKKYSILNNDPRLPGHYVNLLDSPVQGDIFDATQFCEAFFHVPKVRLEDGNDVTNEMECLNPEGCRVNYKKKETSQPKYVVSFVVLRRGDDVEYKAMYENCVRRCGTIHAEEFFDDDAREGDFKRILDQIQQTDDAQTSDDSQTSDDAQTSDDSQTSDDAQTAALNSKFKKLSVNDFKLYMYITLQPCHKSTFKNKNKTELSKKNCTETLINLYRDILEPLGIEFIVKPTFIYRAYWNPELTAEKSKATKNAKSGLEKLCQVEGIRVEAMLSDDWTFLQEQLCPSVKLFPKRPYTESERKKLDNFIGELLTGNIKARVGAPQASGSTPQQSTTT